MKYENEEQIRKDFARLFNWYEQRGMYETGRSLRTPEWAEVFAEIGRLLQQQINFQDEQRIRSIERRVERIEGSNEQSNV